LRPGHTRRSLVPRGGRRAVRGAPSPSREDEEGIMRRTILALAVASLLMVASVANSGPPVPSVQIANIPLPVTSAEKAVPYTALRSTGGGGYCEVIGDGNRTTTTECQYNLPFTEARLVRSLAFRPIEPTVQLHDGGASCVAVLWVHPTGDPDVAVVIGTANWTSGDYRTLYQPLPVPVAFPANEALYLRVRMSIVGGDNSQGCALQGTSMMMTTE